MQVNDYVKRLVPFYNPQVCACLCVLCEREGGGRVSEAGMWVEMTEDVDVDECGCVWVWVSAGE